MKFRRFKPQLFLGLTITHVQERLTYSGHQFIRLSFAQTALFVHCDPRSIEDEEYWKVGDQVDVTTSQLNYGDHRYLQGRILQRTRILA
jgi:hypothetical protein